MAEESPGTAVPPSAGDLGPGASGDVPGTGAQDGGMSADQSATDPQSTSNVNLVNDHSAVDATSGQPASTDSPKVDVTDPAQVAAADNKAIDPNADGNDKIVEGNPVGQQQAAASGTSNLPEGDTIVGDQGTATGDSATIDDASSTVQTESAPEATEATVADKKSAFHTEVDNIEAKIRMLFGGVHDEIAEALAKLRAFVSKD